MMDSFFQVLKNHSCDAELCTVTGIDGEMAGKKAITGKEGILYCSEGIPGEVETLFFGRLPMGITETGYGRIFVEAFGTGKKLILCGGGHVSSAVLSVAKMLEFQVTVLEDRVDFAQRARLLGADQVICDAFSHGLQQLATDRDTCIAVMTRGHSHDLDCLHQLLCRDYAYLGMMGSRSRVKKIREQLVAEGFPQERIDSIHAPIGLSIGAETPAEIAVSVMAEIIQVRSEHRKLCGYDKEITDWLFSREDHKEAVMALIIGRKGSAPRQVGTRMVVFADGTSLGTIGGGCMEAEVKGIARHMLADRKEICRTCRVDMTGRDAQEEGMVCGGTVEVFLEIL